MTDEPTTELATRDTSYPALGITPRTLDEAWHWAKQASESGLVPKAYYKKPHDVLTALQLGSEVGLPPMASLQSIGVVNGRPGLYGDGLLAVVVVAPVYEKHVEHYEVSGPAHGTYRRVDELTPEDLKQDTTRARCTFWRKGAPEPTSRTFSIAQAKKANLVGKQGPWTEYPDRMLLMRARGFAARDAFPDVLKGIKTVEELRDIPLEEPRDVTPPEKTVQRKSAAPVAPVLDVPAPEPEAETLVARVRSVDRTLTHVFVNLANGLVLELPEGDPEDAIGELVKFIDKDQALRFLYRPIGDGRLRLVDFRIAE